MLIVNGIQLKRYTLEIADDHTLFSQFKISYPLSEPRKIEMQYKRIHSFLISSQNTKCQL